MLDIVKRLFAKTPSTDLQALTVAPLKGHIPKALFLGAGVRPGMWVMTGEGVGITRALQEQEAQPGLLAQTWVVVDLVNAEGLTRVSINTLPSSLRIAAYSDIPSARMKIDRAHAARLGYV